MAAETTSGVPGRAFQEGSKYDPWAIEAKWQKRWADEKVFETEAVFWSWLTVLARSALVDESRKRRRYFSFLEKFTRHQEATPAVMNNGEADEQLRELLDRKMTALPDDERQLVELKYLRHQSVREIADGLQTTDKAVESKLSRVRRKLKDAVLDELKNEQPR